MWDGERAELSGMVGFVLQSSVIYAWTWKKVEREKHRTHRALVSFLWQPEDYYHTLPFIIKGLALMGSETLWDGGKTACCILSSQLSQKETEWMNPNKTTPISLVITGDSVVNTHLWWTEPVPVKQPAESGFGVFNNINWRDYPVSKHASHRIASWLGSRPPQFRSGQFPTGLNKRDRKEIKREK